MKLSVFITFNLLLLLLYVSSCKEKDSNYLRWIGDSEFDPALDDSTFGICTAENRVKQYFHLHNGLPYKGEKIAVWNAFQANYKTVQLEESGWVRIRFIVNCYGETGRFRIMGADRNYQAFDFNSEITDQLLRITKSLDGWKTNFEKTNKVDYYTYINFKINRGELIEIMP